MNPTPFYQDDHVTIYHGDCGAPEFADILAGADVMVTDPPYGIDHRKLGTNRGKVISEGSASIANDRDTSARDDILEVWGARPALVFGSWSRPAPRDTRQWLVWHKDEGGAGIIGNHRGYRRDWEAVFMVGPWPVDRTPRSSVLSFGGNRVESASSGHPHTKPIALMRALIDACPPGVIVDPFMGSGSTLRAAMELGRHAIGFDIEERWCAVARDRMGQGALFTGSDA